MEWLVEWIGNLLGKIFGSYNDRLLKKYWKVVREGINPQEPKFQAMPDEAFKGLAAQWRERLAKGEALDALIPEVFAASREAGRRTTKMRHFDVQMIGGLALHGGMIAEMTTGEGKTLVATSAVALNALAGKGVHVVTVNDYLARRDTQWMGPIYDFLGLTVATIQHEISFRYKSDYHPEDARFDRLELCTRQEAYAADVTYGTNNEFGFDYLRDNMKIRKSDQVQRGHHYAIVDEVDSILIDEARTPLIISGPAQESVNKYAVADGVARRLKRGEEIKADDGEVTRTGDYVVKEKEHMVILTEEGTAKAEQMVGVDTFFSGDTMDWPHFIETALKAHSLYRRDRDYIIKDGEIIIIDEFTGRQMPGRRWSDGLHQAVEAKEGVRVQEENQTLATITLQNYFKMYGKLAGMTGTAATEAAEFLKIYNLDVCIVPTNKPMCRTNGVDVIFGTEEEKFNVIEEEIARTHETGRPILVGTTSIEKSEILSERLKMRGVKHEVLNAKFHEREAAIIAQTGQRDAVTIATNMAGRGTDILLGDGVAALGGLHIIGTERHEARRIDNQLRGRCARQGDPGSSQFFLSLEDDLFRKFAPPWVRAALVKMGLKDGERIESRMVGRAIEKAQKNVEAYNFQIRKNLIEYDDVRNKQRQVIYALRDKILRGENLRETMTDMIASSVRAAVDRFVTEPMKKGDFDPTAIAGWMQSQLGVDVDLKTLAERRNPDEVEALMLELATARYDAREKELGAQTVRDMERLVLLDRIDEKWKDLLYGIDQLRDVVGLQSYAQQDPKLYFKREATTMFGAMMESIEDEVASLVLRLKLVEKEEAARLERRWKATEFRKDEAQSALEGAGPGGGGDEGGAEEKPQPYRGGPKVGRNEPCHCGSGKKYKKCHGLGAS